MLSQTNPLKNSIACALVALAGSCAGMAWAEEPAPAFSLPPGSTGSLSAEQIREATELGTNAVRSILDAYNARPKEEDAFAAQVRKRVDTIADAAMEEDRQAVLNFLGIDPQSETGLYVFVSWSMPLEMLRSYAVESMWSGATLVFKGIPPGKELGTFITEDLRQLVYGKGAAANVSIDPRLFDAYAVNTVPTTVFTRVRQDIQCQGVQSIEVPVAGGQAASYDTCPALDPANYWKISGAVTSGYALQAFIDDGATDARPHLASLARGFSGAAAPAKEQRAFAGKWEDFASPSEQMAAREAAKAISDAATPK
jgi:type-F conjugative transfer system pilin assembly protein TrbC